MSQQKTAQYASYRLQGTPRDLDAQGFTTAEQEDLKILQVNGVLQRVLLTKTPYHDHNNHKKFVITAAYEVVYKTLPSQLPTLLPPPASPAYAIRDVPGKGKGLIATRDIFEGEVVILERPILLYPRTMGIEDNLKFQAFVRQTIDPQDFLKFADLTNTFDDDVPKFLGISLTNAFGVVLRKGKESYSGVFLEASRLNHSCGPNVVSSWNPYLYAFTVHAVRPIKAGQELTTPYEPLCETHANRRYDLERKYKFECKCGYCTKTSSNSDLDRALRDESVIRISQKTVYDDIVNRRYIQGAENFAINLAKSIVVLRKEGIESTSLLWHYVYLMKLYGLCGNARKFKSWGFKAVLISGFYTNREGHEACLNVEEWIDWIREPKTFPDWNKVKWSSTSKNLK